MHRVFKTKHFHRWMGKTDLTDQCLCNAISEMIHGLVNAHLGGSIVKKRVAVAGRGKRGGQEPLLPRTLVIIGFFCTDLRKMYVLTLPIMN